MVLPGFLLAYQSFPLEAKHLQAYFRAQPFHGSFWCGGLTPLAAARQLGRRGTPLSTCGDLSLRRR